MSSNCKRSNSLIRSPNAPVTSSNSRVMSSNPLVTSANLSVQKILNENSGKHSDKLVGVWTSWSKRTHRVWVLKLYFQSWN